MTFDDTPRTRSDGMKGKGTTKKNEKNIYSSKHVRLQEIVIAKGKGKNNNTLQNGNGKEK